MSKTATTLLALLVVLYALAAPIHALASCPLLNPQLQAHSCCPKPHTPPPVSKCMVQCANVSGELASVQLPTKPHDATFVAVQVEPLRTTMAIAVEFHPAPILLDSSGLYLRVRVLRV